MACAIVPISSRRPTREPRRRIALGQPMGDVGEFQDRARDATAEPEGEREGQHGHGADHPGVFTALAQVAASTSSR